jgi:hypothetical protein
MRKSSEYQPKPWNTQKPGWTGWIQSTSLGRIEIDDLEAAAFNGPERLNVSYVYGEGPNGPYPQMYRIGGGGVIGIPYVVMTGGFRLGFIETNRGTNGVSTYEFPGGFLELGDSPELTVIKETQGEFAVREYQPIKVSAAPFNAERAFHLTAGDVPPGGVEVYVMEVPFRDLIPNPHGKGFVLVDQAIEAHRIAEGIKSAIFLQDSVRNHHDSVDGISRSAYIDWQYYRDEFLVRS